MPAYRIVFRDRGVEYVATVKTPTIEAAYEFVAQYTGCEPIGEDEPEIKIEPRNKTMGQECLEILHQQLLKDFTSD